MLIFEASAGNEFWPHPLRPAGLQAAAKGSSWGGPKLIRPTSGDQGVGPPFAHKWGHDLPTEPSAGVPYMNPGWAVDPNRISRPVVAVRARLAQMCPRRPG